MNDIEQIKIDLTLKVLSNTLRKADIDNLPINDDIRSFVCSIGPKYARWYAEFTEGKPHNDTREASCNDSEQAYWYALYVDKGPTTITRCAAFKDYFWREAYLKNIDKILDGNIFIPIRNTDH